MAEKAYDLHSSLLNMALEQASKCVCADGCPACVGPSAGGREVTLRLLRLALTETSLAPYMEEKPA